MTIAPETRPVPRRVSVVVPTFNRPALLRTALASIRAIEGPDLTFQILVGDNGSAPETAAVAAEFGALYMRVSQRGAGAARNACLRVADGDFIAFLDDDDAWLPSNIRAQIEVLDAQPELEGVLAQAVSTDAQLDCPGKPWPDPDPGTGDALLRRMLGGYFPQLGTLVVRGAVPAAIGLFDEALIYGQDLDWQLRIARRRSLSFTAVPVMLFRGRTFGSYDALQAQRQWYDRQIFLRHSLPEWRIWRSPLEFLEAYKGTLQHFYWYFLAIVVEAEARGDYRRTLRALWGAVTVFPARAVYHVLRRAELRRALITAALRSRAPGVALAPHSEIER